MQVRSNRARAYNAAPTFSERNELIPPRTERPDKDRVQPGDLSEFGIKAEELVKKTKEILSESQKVAKDKESDFISEIGEPSSSHASRKSCHSCAEENTVCLHECPNNKKNDDDAEGLKSTNSTK